MDDRDIISIEQLPDDDIIPIDQLPNSPVQKKSIFPTVGVEAGGFKPSDIAISTVQGIGKDIMQPAASYYNQLLLNNPRALVEKLGYEYPSESGVTSPIANVVSRGAGIAGGVTSPLVKWGLKAPTLLKQMGRGAVVGGSYAPEDFTDVGQRMTGATIGGALPLIPKAVKGVSKGISNISKANRDYLYEKVAKPTSETISQNLRANPAIGKALKLKDKTIELMNKFGYDRISNPELVLEESENAFQNAMGQKTTVYGNKIDIRNTLKTLENSYNEIKKVNPNHPILKIIEDLRVLKPAPKGFFEGMPGGLSEERAIAAGFKKPSKQIYGRLRSGENLKDISNEVRITREEFSALRDRLNRLYKENSFDREIYKAINALYGDAEKSGLKGIQKARELFKQHKDFADVYNDLNKLEKLDSTKLHNDLLTVVNEPSKYKSMVDKYSIFIGKQNAEKVFKDALNVRSGRLLKKGIGFAIATGIGAGTVGRAMGGVTRSGIKYTIEK